MLKRICVVDGQGGGIGAAIIKYLRESIGDDFEVIGLGTNAIATAQMLKAGASKGASGENAICQTVMTADCIIGSISISWANAMLGEVTLKIAQAVILSPAKKIFIPLSQENVLIAGVKKEPLPHLIQEAVEKIKEVLNRV